jgi:hypothetical protein
LGDGVDDDDMMDLLPLVEKGEMGLQKKRATPVESQETRRARTSEDDTSILMNSTDTYYAYGASLLLLPKDNEMDRD